VGTHLSIASYASSSSSSSYGTRIAREQSPSRVRAKTPCGYRERSPRSRAAVRAYVTFQFESLYLFKTVGDARARARRDGCVAIARAFEQNEKNIWMIITSD
jgi:hypothetical protein